MPGEQAHRIRQEAAAGRDAYVAGGHQFIFNIGAAAAAEPVVPGLLPRDVPGFTGREGELDRLAGLAGGGSVVVTAIGGTAGVGKTALAVHAAHELLPEFPDGHLYADLRGYTTGQVPAGPSEVLEVFLRRLGVSGKEVPVSVEERSGLLRQLLASRRVLMLLDNAATEGQVRPLLPGAGRSLVIVTSRSVLPGLEADDRIDLDVLSEAEAVGLLAGLIGPDRAATEPETVAEVAGLCGRLPLALRIAGQLLATHPAWPVAKLAGMLAGEQDRLARLAAGDLQVRPAFEVSYAQLAEGDARLFRLLGLHPGPDFTVAAAASLAGTDPEEAGRVLVRLAEAHLVTEHAAGRFGMHDLLRLFAAPPARRPTARPTGRPPRPAWSVTTSTWPGPWIPACTRSCARRRRGPQSRAGCRFRRCGRRWRCSGPSGPACWPRSAWPHSGAGMSRYYGSPRTRGARWGCCATSMTCSPSGRRSWPPRAGPGIPAWRAGR